jgi:hypothetical protein
MGWNIVGLSLYRGILSKQDYWTHSPQDTPRLTPSVNPGSALVHWFGSKEPSHFSTVHTPSGRPSEDYVDLAGLQTDRSSTSVHRESWDLLGTGTWALNETLRIMQARSPASPQDAEGGDRSNQASHLIDTAALRHDALSNTRTQHVPPFSRKPLRITVLLQ